MNSLSSKLSAVEEGIQHLWRSVPLVALVRLGKTRLEGVAKGFHARLPVADRIQPYFADTRRGPPRAATCYHLGKTSPAKRAAVVQRARAAWRVDGVFSIPYCVRRILRSADRFDFVLKNGQAETGCAVFNFHEFVICLVDMARARWRRAHSLHECIQLPTAAIIFGKGIGVCMP